MGAVALLDGGYPPAAPVDCCHLAYMDSRGLQCTISIGAQKCSVLCPTTVTLRTSFLTSTYCLRVYNLHISNDVYVLYTVETHGNDLWLLKSILEDILLNWLSKPLIETRYQEVIAK